MTPYHLAGLLLFVVLAAIFLVRYVNDLVDAEFRNLARAEADGEYRGEELARLDRRLSGRLPLPPDVKPLDAPTGGFWALFPPALFALGIIMLWGGLFAPERTEEWLYGGLGATALACVIMLATLRRRKWQRLARLLRFRADLRRIDGDRRGSAADVADLLRLTPWDDAAWAELADDLAAQKDLPGALDAVRQAARLDPDYDEYRMLEASLAIRLGRTDEAREAVRAWTDLGGIQPDDPRLVIYSAAIDLAEGRPEDAARALEGVLLDEDGAGYEFLDMDDALADVRLLLPGRG